MSELIPRLSLSDMVPRLAVMLQPRVDRLGYLGQFFQCAAHQPQALMSFMTFTEDLKQALPNNLTEVVALSVTSLMENAYERVQHERLCLKLGFAKQWVRELISLRTESDGPLSEPELLVQKLVLAVLTRQGHDTRAELAAVVQALGHAHAMALLMLIGQYVTHGLMVNCLNLASPVPSPLREK